MIGAIFGDIVGSVYERNPIKTTDFPLFHRKSRFTDDTVLTLATAEVLTCGGEYGDAYRRYARRYPRAGYGGGFKRWARSPHAGPYYSYGNGSAMRVSPIGWAFDDIDDVLSEAQRSASVTHNHPEGIRGAQAVAAAVCMARHGEPKRAIKSEIEKRFGYRLDDTIERMRPSYVFDVTCAGTVPAAIIAFLEAASCEGAVRKAVSLGGDADTLACIAGAIAEAYFGIPAWIEEKVLSYLDDRMRETIAVFRQRFCGR